MVNGLETEIQHNNKIRLIRIKIRELIVNRNPFHNLGLCRDNEYIMEVKEDQN